jgi:hypothetical protein
LTVTKSHTLLRQATADYTQRAREAEEFGDKRIER